MNPKADTEAALLLVRLAAAHELLEVLTKTGTERQIGRSALLLAFILGATPEKSQRNLSRRLKISEAAISLQMKAIREVFPWLTSTAG
jgi:hypothetical protein